MVTKIKLLALDSCIFCAASDWFFCWQFSISDTWMIESTYFLELYDIGKYLASVLIPNYCDKLKKLLTADANDLRWQFFHGTLFFQSFCDFLVWCPSKACVVSLSRSSSKIVSVCSQYCCEIAPNTKNSKCHFVTSK